MNPAATPLPDIRDIVPPHPYFLPAQYLWLLLAALVLFAAGWYAAVRFRRAHKIAPLTPRQIAALRLQDLQRNIETIDPRTFGGEVCDALRVYIGSQYGLQTVRQTSPEFLNSITGSSVFSPAEQGLLASFLEQCDLLKFAKHDATLPAKQGLLEQATNFLENTGLSAGNNQPVPHPANTPTLTQQPGGPTPRASTPGVPQQQPPPLPLVPQ